MFPFLENRLIFHPDRRLIAAPADYGLRFEEVRFPAGDGTLLHGWLMPPAGEATEPPPHVLFLHGNAGNISHRLDQARGLLLQGLAVLLFDYRGYGRSRGRPSEAGLYQDAAGAHRFLVQDAGVDPRRIFPLGRSLGGAAAADLALRRPMGGVIIESSFTSLRDMARSLVPFLPRGLASNRFDVLTRIRGLGIPALFVHGERDELVPVAMGRRLYEAHPGPKDWYGLPRAGHNDTHIIGGSAYFQRLAAFIAGCLGRRP